MRSIRLAAVTLSAAVLATACGGSTASPVASVVPVVTLAPTPSSAPPASAASIAPPSAASASPTDEQTSSPQPSTSAEPSLTAEPGTTTEPSASASEAASPSAGQTGTSEPSVGPVPSGLPSLSPDSTLLIQDAFDTDEARWGVIDAGDAGKIEWADGVLRFSAASAQGSLQSTKPFPDGETWEEVAAVGEFTPTEGADASLGFYCFAVPDSLIGGLVTVNGVWAVIAGGRNSVQVIERGELPTGAVALGETAKISYQCSAAEGDLPPLVRLAVGGTIVATVEVPAEQASMTSFGSLGLWVEPTTPPMSVDVDNVQALGRHEPRRESDGPTSGASPSQTP